VRDVLAVLKAAGSDMPVLIGGRLNEIPEDSNSGLPVDVKADIEALGALPCETPEVMTHFIENFIKTSREGTRA
jgi:hypothetical protein